jgi:8-oxo-dGTP diphosphatase
MTGRNVSVLILYDHERRILLQHRTEDAPIFPNHWAFFGGGLEEGESPEQAVKREGLEELGYAVTAATLLAVQRFVHNGHEYIKHVFVEKYDGSALTLGEGQGMGWFLPAETGALLMVDHDRSIVDAMTNVLNSAAAKAG